MRNQRTHTTSTDGPIEWSPNLTVEGRGLLESPRLRSGDSTLALGLLCAECEPGRCGCDGLIWGGVPFAGGLGAVVSRRPLGASPVSKKRTSFGRLRGSTTTSGGDEAMLPLELDGSPSTPMVVETAEAMGGGFRGGDSVLAFLVGRWALLSSSWPLFLSPVSIRRFSALGWPSVPSIRIGTLSDSAGEGYVLEGGPALSIRLDGPASACVGIPL